MCRARDASHHTVREGALAADVLLEGGGGGAADVDLAVEDDEDEEGGRERGDVRRHHRRLEGAREGPRDVAGGVADVGAHARRTAGDVKVERFGHPREHLGEPRGEEEAAAGELGQSEAAAVPRVWRLVGREQLEHL